jgi:PAS domain S-box-containing protein
MLPRRFQLDDEMALPVATADVTGDRNPTHVAEPTWLSRRLRDLLMRVPSAIGITVGPEHRWAYVNVARVKMAGRGSAQDFIGKTVRESYKELEGQPFFAALDQVYRTGVPFIGKEVKATFNRGPNGAPEDAYLDCVYQPILSPDGEVEGLLIHTVEVSEQVLARRAIEEANQREQHQRAAAEFERNQLRELFKQAPAGIGILAGPEHRWSFVNPTFCEILGRSADRLVGRTIRQTLPEIEGQGFFELLDQVYSSGVAYIGKNTKASLNRGPGNASDGAYFDFVYHPARNMDGQVEGVMILAVEVTDQLEARAQLESHVQERTLELQRAHESLRLLSGRLMQAQDEERRRVARELHDSAGQYLAALQMNLKDLCLELNVTERFRRRLEDSVDLVDRCSAEIRTLSYLLHPPLLDEVGLASAISWYVEGFSDRSGIAVDLSVPENLPRFSSELDTALFRIVQQSLSNLHKHSGSKVAGIRLAVAGSNLTVEISDEGRGISSEILSRFRESGQSPGVGISGMRERVIGLRGTFDLKSDHSGTTIIVTVPISGQP